MNNSCNHVMHCRDFHLLRRRFTRWNIRINPGTLPWRFVSRLTCNRDKGPISAISEHKVLLSDPLSRPKRKVFKLNIFCRFLLNTLQSRRRLQSAFHSQILWHDKCSQFNSFSTRLPRCGDHFHDNQSIPLLRRGSSLHSPNLNTTRKPNNHLISFSVLSKVHSSDSSEPL